MDKDLRKRFEKVAEDYAINDDSLIDSCDTTSVSDGFLAGAEYGYKEAIAMACRWLQSKCDFIDGDNLLHLDFKCECFRKEMNKLLED